MPDRSRYVALAAMLFAVAMTFIDQTIVAIAAPSIQMHLGLTSAGTTWAVNAYLLALAATFALGGRLADVLGSRRMVTIGIIGFAASSALCGATPTTSVAETWLVVFRVAQGVAAALMVPAALAIVVAAFPVRERGRALALFFGISGGLTAIGPIAGGVLTQWTWRSIFWINVPIAIVALVLLLRSHTVSPRRDERIDYAGAAMIAVGMVLSVFGFEQAGTWGWRSVATWACIVGGLVVLVVFVGFERRHEQPLMKVWIFRERAFFLDNAVLLLSNIAFVPLFFFASLYAQIVLGYDANQAGLYLLVIFAGFAPAAQVGGRMLDRGGARRPLVIGSALSAVGFALWAGKVHDYSLGSQWPFIVMAAAGIGLVLGPASTDAVNRAIDASYGEVTGITQTVRNYGSTFGLAVLGSVLTNVFSRHLTTSLTQAGLPASFAHKLATSQHATIGTNNGPLFEATLHDSVQHDFATGIQAVLIGMAIALGASFVVALRHPGRQAFAMPDLARPDVAVPPPAATAD
jgi:EmrB/QacA subfamily drug resistance transporter